jgi:uncharacterized protein (TIGR04551 family)
MTRLLAAALAAELLLAGAARAQSAPAAPAAKDAAPAKDQPAAKPSAADQLDPRTRALVQEEIAKAKEDIRNEVRAEMQGAQAAAEFLGAVSEGPKLQFLEVDGYLRFRGDLLDDLAILKKSGTTTGLDASGYPLYPVPLTNTSTAGTIATANMRLRIEPTLNVSEYVRVRAQIDILDNYVLGSSAGPLYSNGGSPYPVPFYASDRVLRPGDKGVDRDAIVPKRAWGEVQTPIGLLSFGRMPSDWGMGILANAGVGLDQDYGDTVDRIQFAIAPVTTPIGKLALVPILDFDAEGPLALDRRNGPGAGQPVDYSNADDARTYSLKLARIDTEDEIRRKLERNESSLNWGAYYGYRVQKQWSPWWYTQDGGLTGNPYDTSTWVKSKAYVNYLDLWARLRTQRWRIELELAGVYGSIADASTLTYDGSPGATASVPKLDLRQWGGALRVEWDALPSRVIIAGEFAIASGDAAPGFGNQPDRLPADPNSTTAGFALPPYGSVEGPQWDLTDRSIRNFRFNPAWQFDMILWREVLGQLTDAFYLRPSVRWTILPGLVLDVAIIYSQALYAQSTPSARTSGLTELPSPATRGTYSGGSTPLGIEGDATLRLDTGTGFAGWLGYGFLLPLGGFGPNVMNAMALRAGLAVKF